jgi:uncharacterized DUF497 family protein
MSAIAYKLGIPDFEFRVVFGRTKIEYDPGKEQINREKHGYSLQSGVQQLERMIFPIGTPPPCVTSDAFLEGCEVRHQHMGVDDSGKIVIMVTTMRPGETVRLISFRRASFEERKVFGSLTGYQELRS